MQSLFGRRDAALLPVLRTERLELRIPKPDDFAEWARLRRDSAAFLQPWEPAWPRDHLGHRAFRRRVRWARVEAEGARAFSFLIFTRKPLRMVGGITLSNIRRGPSQCGTLGYWVGADHAQRGYMREATEAVVGHAFDELRLTRLEAACLEENVASRALLASCGFRFEGIARSYLEVDGVVRDHMLFARVAGDEP
jgi:ribosomal-protein-alanine N-acetyltransferase